MNLWSDDENTELFRFFIKSNLRTSDKICENFLWVNQKYNRTIPLPLRIEQFAKIIETNFVGSIFLFYKIIQFSGRVTIVTNNPLISRRDVRRRCAQYRLYKTQRLTLIYTQLSYVHRQTFHSVIGRDLSRWGVCWDTRCYTNLSPPPLVCSPWPERRQRRLRAESPTPYATYNHTHLPISETCRVQPPRGTCEKEAVSRQIC